LSVVVMASCTLTRDEVTACARRDCLLTFGPGYVCGANGLCEHAPPNPRCTKTFPEDLLTRPESYPDAIRIGVLMDRGVEVQAGREDAIKLAATQVNDPNGPNGLDGRKFGIVFCDIAEDTNKYDSLKRGAAAMQGGRYLADVIGVPAIIGPSASNDALAVFDATKAAEVLILSPASTSPSLTGYDGVAQATDDVPGLLWRTAVSDVVQGSAIARHLTEKFPDDKHVVVIHEKGAYGGGLKDVFTQAYQKDGRTVTALEFSSAAERDFAVLEAPKSAPKTVLFFSSQTLDAVAFLNAAKANENESYKDLKLFLTDSGANPDLLSKAAGASSVFPRVTGSRPAIPKGPTFDLFKTSYNVAFEKDPSNLSFVPHSYDAAWLVFFGTAWSVRQEHAVTPRGIARGLRRLSAVGSPEIPVGQPDSWGKILAAFSTAAPVNIVGASGSLDFDPITEETSGLIDIWKISPDGKQIESTATINPQ
jgi:branched-chain amino acid transport system substrate-binding protein